MRDEVVIGFGSQTGSAEAIAWRVFRLVASRLQGRMDANVVCLDDFDPVSCRFALFVVSTAGQGEVPDNMKVFWRNLLKKSAPRLDSLQFSVFGLGDSSYPIYNAAARKLTQRLLDLGAELFYPRELGDDQDPMGYDKSVEPWARGVCDKIFSIALPSHVTSQIEEKTFHLYSVERLQSREVALVDLQSLCFGSGVNRYSPFLAEVTENKRLTPEDHWQDVRHLEFDVEGSGIEYRPGDVLLLHCENDPGIIVPFIRNRIGLDPDQVIQVNALYPGCFLFPKELSLRDLFCKFLDVLGTPKRHFFEVAANYAASEHEIERLRELASAEGSEDLNRYCFRERRTFIEVMEDFPSLDFPLAFFLDSIPTLKPRQFSISSSPLVRNTICLFIHALRLMAIEST